MAFNFDRWLASASRNTLAFILIGGGIVLLLVFNPPHTICDTQVEQFKTSQKGFLFRAELDKVAKKRASYVEMRDFCKQGNSPGACYELFSQLRAVVRDLESVSPDCSTSVGEIPQVRGALLESADLLVRIAWGEKAPATAFDKYAWLDPADIALFCSLKKQIHRHLGEATWERYREKLFTDLPTVGTLTRQQAWERMILSDNCAKF